VTDDETWFGRYGTVCIPCERWLAGDTRSVTTCPDVDPTGVQPSCDVCARTIASGNQYAIVEFEDLPPQAGR